MIVVTLIAAGSLTDASLSEAVRLLAAAGEQPGEPCWLDAGDAATIACTGDIAVARLALDGKLGAVDVVVQHEAAPKRLLIADMDSTMITVECIDELADYAGIKPQIAEITERAMRGELDFGAALDERVALLKGLPERVIAECLADRVKLMPGARTLVQTMRAHGAQTILVSGGFTRFAEPVGDQIGFQRVVANVLDLTDGALTGTVAKPIVDSATKERELLAAIARHGLTVAETLAVGDGANDIPMLEAAGLGIAYHAKPATRARADAAIDHGDLTALLWAQGIARADWVLD